MIECDGSGGHRRGRIRARCARLRALAGIVALLVVTGGLPTAGEAQEHILEITPSAANGFFPSTVFGATLPDGTELETRLEDALAGGLSLGIRPVDALSIELELLVSDTQSSTSVPATSPGVSVDVGTTYTYMGGAVRYRLPVSWGRLRPSVVAGVGGKDFEAATAGTESPLAGSFGAGVRLEIPGWPDLRTEVRDYVSSFSPDEPTGDTEIEEHVQHDIFWSIGAVLGVF